MRDVSKDEKSKKNPAALIAVGAFIIIVILLIIIIAFISGKDTDKGMIENNESVAATEKEEAFTDDKKSESDSQDKVTTTEAVVTQTTENTQTTEENVSSNMDSDYAVFTTDMYTLTLPKKWETAVSTNVNPGEYNDYYVAFYHKASSEADMGGYLFGIAMFMDGDESYMDYPSYEVLGRLIYRQAESYMVVAVFPTDVQFSDDTASEYRELYDQIDSVLESFEVKSEYIFERE